MRMKLEIEAEKPYLEIEHTAEDWQSIKRNMEGIGLERNRTENAFDTHTPIDYFRLPKSDRMLNWIKQSVVFENCRNELIDDINSPIIMDKYFNVAIFRIIPTNETEPKVKIPLAKFLTIAEFRDIVRWTTKIYEFVLNVATEAEVNIRVVKK